MSSAMEQQVAVAYKRHRRYMTAKKKRELERLREEYNKIKEFNDRSIEMQMRRVRLNHLFREIEVIKEQTAAKVRHQQMHPTIRPKTPEELRKETIKRSKELGIEFSKVNALLYNSFGHGYLTASSPKKTQKKEMSSYEKRKRYGMAISRNYYVQRAQMQMMQMDRKNKNTYGSSSQQALKGSELSKTEVEKIKQLRSRLAYGNQQSYINMLKILHQQKRTIHKSKSMPAYPTTNLDSTDIHASTDNESKLESAIPDTDADTDVEIVRGTVHYTTDEDTKTDTEEANANAQQFVQERFRKLAQFALDLKAKMNRIPELRSPTNSLHQIPSEVNVSAYQMDKMPKRTESLDKFLDAVDSDEQLIKHSKYEQQQQSPREKDVKDEQKIEVSLSPKQNFDKETIIKDLFATPPPLPLPPQRIDSTPASQPQLGIKPQPLLYARTAPPPPPPPRERMPTKQLASTPSFAFHNIFKSSDKPVPANAEKMPPVESPNNNTMVTPDPMKIAKMCEEQISETVKHTIMSCKELRQIFEH